jgi:hypothetical protein
MGRLGDRRQARGRGEAEMSERAAPRRAGSRRRKFTNPERNGLPSQSQRKRSDK